MLERYGPDYQPPCLFFSLFFLYRHPGNGPIFDKRLGLLPRLVTLISYLRCSQFLPFSSSLDLQSVTFYLFLLLLSLVSCVCSTFATISPLFPTFLSTNLSRHAADSEVQEKEGGPVIIA